MIYCALKFPKFAKNISRYYITSLLFHSILISSLFILWTKLIEAINDLIHKTDVLQNNLLRVIACFEFILQITDLQNSKRQY